MTGLNSPVASRHYKHNSFDHIICLWENASGSEWTSAVPVSFCQGPAPVEVGLAPDPWLVGAAHIGFYQMDPAEVPLFCYPAQERADRDILTGVGIAHLNRHNIPEIFRNEIGTVYRCAVSP